MYFSAENNTESTVRHKILTASMRNRTTDLCITSKGGHWAVHLYMCTFIEFKSKKCVHVKDIRMDDRMMFQNKKRYENQ